MGGPRVQKRVRDGGPQTTSHFRAENGGLPNPDFWHFPTPELGLPDEGVGNSGLGMSLFTEGLGADDAGGTGGCCDAVLKPSG